MEGEDENRPPKSKERAPGIADKRPYATEGSIWLVFAAEVKEVSIDGRLLLKKR